MNCRNFFEKKGAVELISLLDGEGYRFDEIDDLLDVSRGYLNDRRDEAVHLRLIVPDQAYRDDSVRRVDSYNVGPLPPTADAPSRSDREPRATHHR